MTQPPFWQELADAAACVPAAQLAARDGYARLTIPVPAGLSGLTERTAALLMAFPDDEGVRRVTVDVRNAQWAAMALELLRASSPEREAT